MQKKLFAWAKLNEGKYPALRLLFAVPNAGKRSLGAARYMKAEGLVAGVPDIWLPVAKFILDGKVNVLLHGLCIEMKRKPNKVTEQQQWWLEQMVEQQWRAYVCYSFEEARDVLLDYVKS